MGILYSSLAAIKAAAKEHAVKDHWTIKVKHSDKSRVGLTCRSSATCPFHLYAVRCDGGAKITALVADHTCEGSAQPKRPEAASVAYLRTHLPRHLHVTRDTTTADIVHVVERVFKTRIQVQQAQRLKRALFVRERPAAVRVELEETADVPQDLVAAPVIGTAEVHQDPMPALITRTVEVPTVAATQVLQEVYLLGLEQAEELRRLVKAQADRILEDAEKNADRILTLATEKSRAILQGALDVGRPRNPTGTALTDDHIRTWDSVVRSKARRAHKKQMRHLAQPTAFAPDGDG